ncbi:MAG: ECF transporter S component [Oscillospiraceae bacterium]|nr:ECF transporter S component [Oscillospiraceae bacterium]
MQEMSIVKKSIITAICIALCVVLPQLFHAIPEGGRIFLPIHIPVILCGLICGWQYGIIAGALGPVLSFLITGMPVIIDLPQMIVELIVYGLMTGILMKFIHTKNTYADLYISLAIAMLLGRVAAAIVRTIIYAGGGSEFSLAIWGTTYFVTGLPGIIIQFAIIPSIVFALMQARVIPKRYATEQHTVNSSGGWYNETAEKTGSTDKGEDIDD